MLDHYKKEKTTPWSEYEKSFLSLITDREIESTLDPKIFAIPTVLLCSELTPDHCHRRLVLEYLQHRWAHSQHHHPLTSNHMTRPLGAAPSTF